MQVERRYGHFCPLARSLELVGERWGLLIVRDLLDGDQRFTDLVRSCGGITPRQLAARLRQLEEAHIVERDREPGRREVWYRLTPAGQELRPTVEALLLWGVRHAGRPPAPDEPMRAYHLLNGTRLALDAAGATVAAPVSWAWRFPDEAYTLSFDGTSWQLSPGEDPDAEVVVETTPRAWATLVLRSPEARQTGDAIRLHGSPSRVQEFSTALGT
jgi:DNA-binding HxlR family transcriptional regulator